MDILKVESAKQLFTYTSKVYSPIAVGDNVYCATENGDILKYNDGGKQQILFTILGCPSSLAYWNFTNSFLIADFAHQSIFKRDSQQVEEIHNLITQYNERAFHGPSSLAISQSMRKLFFTDSGAFGQTSIQNKAGSLFVFKFQEKTLTSLCHRELAYPCGLALESDENYLYLCEKGENRILKFLLNEGNCGNYTVFHQFNGRVGPSSICLSHRLLFVSLFEFKDLSQEGIVAVLNEGGDLLEKLALPTGPEITGINFVSSNNEQNGMVMLVSQENKLHQIRFKGQKGESQQQSQLNEVSLSQKK